MGQLSEIELREFARRQAIKERDKRKAEMDRLDGELMVKKLKYYISDKDWDSILAMARAWDYERRLYMCAQIKLSPLLGGGR